MKYSYMFKSIKVAVLNTYKKVHFVPIILTFAIVFINKYILKDIDINFDTEKISTYLNGLSILSTFFIFSIQGINFKYVNEKFNKKKLKKNIFKGTQYEVTEANELRYTCYSLSVISFILIFLIYIFLYSGALIKYIDIIFLFTIIYIFNALIFTLSIWNATNTK